MNGIIITFSRYNKHIDRVLGQGINPFLMYDQKHITGLHSFGSLKRIPPYGRVMYFASYCQKSNFWPWNRYHPLNNKIIPDLENHLSTALWHDHHRYQFFSTVFPIVNCTPWDTAESYNTSCNIFLDIPLWMILNRFIGGVPISAIWCPVGVHNFTNPYGQPRLNRFFSNPDRIKTLIALPNWMMPTTIYIGFFCCSTMCTSIPFVWVQYQEKVPDTTANDLFLLILFNFKDSFKLINFGFMISVSEP